MSSGSWASGIELIWRMGARFAGWFHGKWLFANTPRRLCRVGGHADVDAAFVERMAAGDVDLAARRVRDVETQKSSALQLDTGESARPGGGAERLGDDGFELFVCDGARPRAEVHGLSLPDGRRRVEDDDLDVRPLFDVP